MRSSLIAFLLLCSTLLGAAKLTLNKHYSNLHDRRHPYTQLLNKQRDISEAKRDANFNKLLVILVDFQEESTDDPNTTGNGKFQLEPDPSYLYSIGSPPHNRQYFLNNLEALRYYYLAASAGSYDLQYDLWPQTGAYTLPQPMAYYNPPDADGDLFVGRMEEYFQSAFEIADSLSPEIDFQSYSHFMIVHAGSDWQHDVFGDTPSDIPSFFIKVGSGKEASVDGGSVLISHACNVPATISQDFDTQSSDGITFHSGYGALNAVIAHEFGHSLGFVDLYNVRNWQPMVGVFDIMDSGGSGVLVDVLNDGSYVMLEGGLPVLPGAWSRALVFGDRLQDDGLLADIGQIELFEEQSLAAGSRKATDSDPIPQILRIPVSDTEYFLVENRSVDPDGDGATAVYASDDDRVILYPTAIDDPANVPTYEYDYLLPSFQKDDGSAIGGGILVWHINDDVIYNQGSTDADGNFVSNYENNTVNTRYNSRGVEIVEADNLPDIGYDWSWYWTGTQYEYFHARKPVLDASGFFVNWSLDPWKPTLSTETEPPLLDSEGMGSLYWISGIGDPVAVMNLSIRTGFFQSTQITYYDQPGLKAGPLINSSFSGLDLPLIASDSITLMSHHNGEWTDLMGPFPWNGQPIDFPLASSDQDGNGFRELLMVHGNALEIVEFSTDALQSKSINYPDPITTTPLSVADTVYVSTPTCLSSIVNNSILEYVVMDGIRRLASYGDDIASLSQDLLHIFDSRDLYIKAEVPLPEPFGDYEPVSYTASSGNVRMLFLMANNGNVYRYESGFLEMIFQNPDPNPPTQMGISPHPTALGEVNPAIFWACGNSIYAIKRDGTLLDGYPYNAYPLKFESGGHVYALSSTPGCRLYLPVAGRGHVAYLAGTGIQWDRSLLNNTANSYLASLESAIPETTPFYWYYCDPEGSLYIHYTAMDAQNEAIEWNGFRNGGSGSFAGTAMSDEIPPDDQFNAYVFPNPVRGGQFRLRIENFEENAEIRLFDINGALVQSVDEPANGILRRDVALDGSMLSSGVYILSVRCGDKRRRIKFTVQK
jgi:M6 family metalloprotease-like protein